VVEFTDSNFTVNVGSVVEASDGLPAAGHLQASAGTPPETLMLQPGCTVETGVNPDVEL
jgi:hypothetical protein